VDNAYFAARADEVRAAANKSGELHVTSGESERAGCGGLSRRSDATADLDAPKIFISAFPHVSVPAFSLPDRFHPRHLAPALLALET
jgi:hypothetical protein